MYHGYYKYMVDTLSLKVKIYFKDKNIGPHLFNYFFIPIATGV